MPLESKLFKGDPALNACLVEDSAHITPGAVGPHVGKIHTALFILDDFSVARDELAMERYGETTAAGVLAYKRKRNIINYSYETQADNIVGKMTIAAMDAELFRKQYRPVPPPDPRSFAWTTRRV